MHAVAHELDDAALILGNQRIDHLRAKRSDGGKRSRFVGFDQARVANDIGGHDGRQSPLRSQCRHGDVLLQPKPIGHASGPKATL